MAPAPDDVIMQHAVWAALKGEILNWYGGPATAAAARTAGFNTERIPSRWRGLEADVRTEMESLQPRLVLDVGCGYGGMSTYLALRYPQAEVVGVDVSDRFFGCAARAIQSHPVPNLTFRSGDLRSLGPQEGCDLLLLVNVVNYLTDGAELRRVLSEAVASLSPHGWVCVHTPQRWSFREPFTKLPAVGWLPDGLRERLVARSGRRSTMRDIRLPRAGEIARALRRGGATEIRRHPAPRKAFKESHVTLWARRGGSS